MYDGQQGNLKSVSPSKPIEGMLQKQYSQREGSRLVGESEVVRVWEQMEKAGKESL